MAKATKIEAQYNPRATRSFCRDCSYWRQGACTEVAGSIAPDATCKWYEKAQPKATAKKR